VKLYRICRRRHLDSCWSGLGAELYGGRWNSVGRRAVYCATSISLAILEVLVHLKDEQALEDFVVLEIQVPDDSLMRLFPLPEQWNAEPLTPTSQQAGDAWLDSLGSLGLVVPSVIVPPEYNVLLNPRHSGFAHCQATAREVELRLDPRLL
jgi:RES domain-containing protein